MSDAMQWLDSCGELLWNVFLWDVAWKGTLLLAAAWIADRLWLRRRLLGADVLWTATLLGLLALPLGAAALPQMTLPIWQAPAVVEVPHEEAVSSPAAPIALDDVPLIDESNWRGAANEATATVRVEDPNPATAKPFPWPSWGATAAAVYLLGSGALLGRLAWGMSSMMRLIRRATPVGEKASEEIWLSVLATRQEQLGVRRNVQLLSSEETAIPFTAGWRSPTIVVPADIAALADEATIDATLLHELTHIARGDYPVHLAGKVVEALYWWNPLAWLAAARLSSVRESICDGYCCWRMGDGQRYGDVLLALAGRLTQRRLDGVGLAMARGSRLGKRLEALTAITIPQPIMRGRRRWGMTLLAIAVSFLSTGVTLGTEKPENVTLADVVARVTEVEDLIETLAGSFHFQFENSYPTAQVTKREYGQQEREEIITNRSAVTTGERLAAFEWQRGERERMESEGSSVTTIDGVEKRSNRSEQISVFDGTNGWWCTTPLDEHGKPLEREGQKIVYNARGFLRPELLPVSCTLSIGPERLSKLLAHKNAKIIRTATVANRPTLVIEADPIISETEGRYGIRLWIDVERGVAVRREAWVGTTEAAQPAPLVVVECSDYQEAAPGIWLPMKIEKRSNSQSLDAEEPEQFDSGRQPHISNDLVEMRQWKVNVKIPLERFTENFPSDAKLLQAPTPPPAPTLTPAPTIDSSNQTRSAETPPNSHRLKVIIVDEAGRPIEGARVRQTLTHIPAALKRSKITKYGDYRTDAAGEATLTCEEKSTYLYVLASHPERVPLHAIWQREPQSTHGPLPEELRFTLKAGTTIGGVVRDEAGNPIAGAKVEIFNLLSSMPTPAGPTAAVQPAPPSPNNAAGATPTQPTAQARIVRPTSLPWLAEGETAILTDDEGRWQATNIPSDEELTLSNKRPRPMMAVPSNEMVLPLRLRISHERFETHDDSRQFTSPDASPKYRNDVAYQAPKGAPALLELRSEEAVVVLRAKSEAGREVSGDGKVGTNAAATTGRPVDVKLNPAPPKLAYLAWHNESSKMAGKDFPAWDLQGKALRNVPVSLLRASRSKLLFERQPNDNAHPLILGFDDSAESPPRHVMVTLLTLGRRQPAHSYGDGSRDGGLRYSVIAPVHPYNWLDRVDLRISYPIESQQTTKEISLLSEEPIEFSDDVRWTGRLEPDGRFASVLTHPMPQGEDEIGADGYVAEVFTKDEPYLRMVAAQVRDVDGHRDDIRWYEGLLPADIVRVRVTRHRHATSMIEDVPIRRDLLPQQTP